MGQGEVLWSMREDFYTFAEKKGGLWSKAGQAIKVRADEWERNNPSAKNETEIAEAEDSNKIQDEEA